MNNMKPNIFNYATSELSQDAFLSWFLDWGNAKYSNTDKELNKIASEFIRNLINKPDSYKIENVEIKKQWKKIDISALVNNKYLIIIEDKKGTKEHSNQLEKYKKIANEHYKNENIEIIPVYYKMQEQSDYKNIINAGYKIFGREDMIKILEKYIKSTNHNDIISDYYEYIVELDKAINSYKTLPINEWHWYSWHGFYTELQKNINGNWDYVSNASGGFLGFWWDWNYANIENKEFEFYLQLEQDRLTFKLYSYNENNRREVRNLFRNILFDKAKELNINISRFGHIGKYMSVARLNSDYRIADKNGILDLTATIDNLKNIMKLIYEVDKQIKST